MRVTSSVEGNSVLINVTFNAAGSLPLTFRRTFENEQVARIVEGALSDEFSVLVEKVRQRAYEHGKRAARHPDARIEHFYGCINTIEVGW